MIEQRTVITCDAPGCEEQYMIGKAIHLAVLQAKVDGWRISQDGTATCPHCATGVAREESETVTRATEKSMADVQREDLLRILGMALMQAENEDMTSVPIDVETLYLLRSWVAYFKYSDDGDEEVPLLRRLRAAAADAGVIWRRQAEDAIARNAYLEAEVKRLGDDDTDGGTR